MPDNFQKLPVQRSLNAIAVARALAAIERTGQALPCRVIAVDGSIVTVSFETQGGPWLLNPITLPKAESQWLRSPTQIGDFGITVPADTYLGGVSGYGDVADLTVDYGNLSTLVWLPIGSSAFEAAPNANKAWANGPAGATLSDSAQAVSIDCDSESGNVTITATNSLAISVGGNTWTFTSAGLTMSTGIVAEDHIHGGIEVGSGVSGTPEA